MDKVQPQLTEEDWALFEILDDPILFQEFFFPDPSPRHKPTATPISKFRWEEGEGLRVYWSQYPYLLWPYGHFAGGRNTGKTEIGIRNDAVWAAIRFPNTRETIGGHTKSHCFTEIYQPLVRIFTRHRIFKYWGPQYGGQTDAENLVITLTNGHVIQFAWPGQAKEDEGGSFTGLRSHRWKMDEFQKFTQSEVSQAMQTMEADPGDPEDVFLLGACRRNFGVPDGRRGNQPMWRHDTSDNSPFVGWRYKMSSVASFTCTEGRHREWCQEYDCHPERGIWTDKYKQDVHGFHGQPVQLIWPPEMVDPCLFDLENYVHESYYPSVMDDYGEDVQRWLYLPPRPPHASKVILGIDVGTRELTVIQVWAEVGDDVWEILCTVDLDGWRKPWHQTLVIDYVATFYQADYIGIDEGSQGIGIISDLRDSHRFDGKDYTKRVVGYHFAAKIVTGTEPNYKLLQEAERLGSQELYEEAQRQRVRIEEYVDEVTALRFIPEHFLQRKYRLPLDQQDPKFLNQIRTYQGELVTSGRSARWTFKPKHPHWVSAFKVFAATKFQKYDLQIEIPQEKEYIFEEWEDSLFNREPFLVLA